MNTIDRGLLSANVSTEGPLVLVAATATDVFLNDQDRKWFVISAATANADAVFLQFISAATRWGVDPVGILELLPGAMIGPIDWAGPVSAYSTLGGTIYGLSTKIRGL